MRLAVLAIPLLGIALLYALFLLTRLVIAVERIARIMKDR